VGRMGVRRGKERRGVMKSGNEVYKKTKETYTNKQKKNKKKDDGV
jgi:hypothetical protein